MRNPTGTPRDVPACMSVADLDLWASGDYEKVDSPCRDCLWSFHFSRLAEGHCDGLPGEARTLADGSYLAHRRAQYRASAKRRHARLVDKGVAFTESDSYDSRCACPVSSARIDP